MHSESNNHAPALFQMNTGFLLPGRPSFGSWVTYGLGAETDRLPAFVVMWDHRGGPIGGAPNWSSGFLPPAYQGTPFRATGDPIVDLKPPPDITPEQEQARLKLLAKMNAEHLEAHPGEEELTARIASYELAFRMQMSAPQVVDISDESPDTQKLTDWIKSTRNTLAANVYWLGDWSSAACDSCSFIQAAARSNCAGTRIWD